MKSPGKFKIKSTSLLPIIYLTLLALFSCAEDDNNIVGSTSHDISLEQPSTPSILADGISTIDIWANVIDKAGKPARGMKVVFESSLGEMTEYDYTDDYGDARGVLTSIASQNDLLATITATVVDTNFESLGKAVAQEYEILLSNTQFGIEKLLKSVGPSSIAQNEGDLEIKFAGISITAFAKEKVLPADGISTASVKVSLFETTSLRPITDGEMYVNSKIRPLSATLTTDSNGEGVFEIRSGENPGLDTLDVSFGNSIKETFTLQYVLPKMSIEAEQNKIIADGASTTNIIATLLTDKNTPIKDATITFSSNDGIVASEAVTDHFGKAVATLIAGKNVNPSVKIKAEFLGLKDSVTVAFVKNVAQNLTFTPANNEKVLRDGVSTKKLVLKVTDSENKPLSALTINLSANIGSIQDSVVTDATGLAYVEYTSDTGSTNTTATVTATIDGKSWTQRIDLQGILLVLSATPDRIPADGTTVSDIQVELKKTESNVAITNYDLNFGTTLGNVPETITTDSRGMASFNFVGGTKAGNAQITAFCGKLTETIEVTLYTKSTDKIITITPENDEPLLRDGVDSKDVKIQVTDIEDNPQAGVTVELSSSIGTVPASVITNESGEATFQFVADAGNTNATATITAKTDGKSWTQNIQLHGLVLTATATPDNISADGVSTASVQVELKKAVSNIPVTSYTMSLGATLGSVPRTIATDDHGIASFYFVAGKTTGTSEITIYYGELSKKLNIALVAKSTEKKVVLQAESKTAILRDGSSTKYISLTVTDADNNPVTNLAVNLGANIGSVPSSVTTDNSGIATFEYTADAGNTNATATVAASIDDKTWTLNVVLEGIIISVTATPDSIPADGSSTSQIEVQLKKAGSNVPVADYILQFGTNSGNITNSQKTDTEGKATITYTAGNSAGTANVTVYCGELSKTVQVDLYQNYSTNLTLESSNNFIWVKETGQIEESDITATVIGVNGNPTTSVYTVEFTISSGAGGGEYLETTSGSSGQTVAVQTTNGIAKAYLRAGTKSGEVQIRAHIVEKPEVAAQSAKLIIRSGPPYMWIDPTDVNNVISHGTVIIEPGKHNTAFANPVQEIGVTATFGDKYNNPVEKDIAVYFTTSGGIITTDASTDELGRTSVTLQNVNPVPVISSPDANQLTGTYFPNPNEALTMLNLSLPDYENSEIINTAGTLGPNDGNATIMAVTSGQDQNGNTVKVWATTRVIYSQALYRFDATIDRDSIRVGERANINIRCYDLNGNPVAAGSKLTVSSNAGKLSVTDLMPPEERYGYGSTFFSTQIVNTLNPAEDKTKPASIEIKLESPNGDATIGLGVVLVVK